MNSNDAINTMKNSDLNKKIDYYKYNKGVLIIKEIEKNY